MDFGIIFPFTLSSKKGMKQEKMYGMHLIFLSGS